MKKYVIVGLGLGILTYGIVRLVVGSAAASDSYIYPIVSAYLLIGLLLSWKMYPAQPPKRLHESNRLEFPPPVRRKKEPISRYGYSFLIGVAIILLLDLALRNV